MTAEEIASKAAALVSGDRAVTHGDKRNNFANIAAYWNAFLYIWSDGGIAAQLEGQDVAKMMVLLKLARMESGDVNPDDAIDAAGYAAIAGELSQPAKSEATYTSLSDAISGTRR